VKRYSLSHLSDQTLLHDLTTLLAHDRTTTTALLAHLAEVDARKLYLPAAYPSMFAYCVQELRLSEDSTWKRIQAARAARRFPIIFEALAEGRLHLSGVCLLAPHLTAGNAEELLSTATHRTKFEIERLLAERFPRPDVPSRMEALSPQPAPGQVETRTDSGMVSRVTSGPVETPAEVAPAAVAPSVPGLMETSVPRPKVAPLSPQRFALQLTMSQQLHDKLRYAQELLSHQVPAGELAAVLERALDALIPQLEKQKFAATGCPRSGRPTTGVRHVPAEVKRAVWERDGGRCTFVSESGRRCPARTHLEFDHMDEVARGGRASVGRIRLRCRAHNQYVAERTFGAEFMREKREAAQRAAAAARARSALPAHVEEVIPYLRQLGYRVDQARSAAARCEHLPGAPLEQRVRHALTYFRLRTTAPVQAPAWTGNGP